MNEFKVTSAIGGILLSFNFYRYEATVKIEEHYLIFKEYLDGKLVKESEIKYSEIECEDGMDGNNPFKFINILISMLSKITRVGRMDEYRHKEYLKNEDLSKCINEYGN